MKTSSERLHAAQAELVSRGVRDVKFYFERGSLTNKPKSEVTQSVAAFLESYLGSQFAEKAGIE